MHILSSGDITNFVYHFEIKKEAIMHVYTVLFETGN